MTETKFTRSQQRAESKRKADEVLPPERPAKLRANARSGGGEKGPQAPSSQSKEALFMARHAAEFDSHSVGQERGSQVQVKQERQRSDGFTPARTESARVQHTIPPGSTSPLVIVPTPRNAIVVGNDADQDDVIVAILSQDTWDDKMRKVTVDNLSDRAKHRTSGGHLFDAGYLNQLLDRLDNAGINAERRSEVVGQLQSVFRQLLSHWNACVDRIGRSGSHNALPYNLLNETIRSTPPSKTTTPNPLRLLDSDTNAESVDIPITRESSSSPTDDQDSWGVGREDQNDCGGTTSQRISLPADATETLSVPSSTNVPLIPRGEKSIHNKRIHGTVCPKATFDVFARSVIAAWAAAPSPEDNPTRIRQYAKPPWQGHVTLDQKEEWHRIYEARKDPFIDVTAMGAALLLSQSLLAKVVPSDRLAAAKLFCQQHQGRLGAIVSSTATITNINTPPAPPRAAVGTAPIVTAPIHQGSFSGSFEDFPRMTQATCDTPNWQPCLVRSGAQKQSVYTCVFVVNTPDKQTSLPLTEGHVRAACHRAQMPGLKEVRQESFNVFLAFFQGFANADQARRRKRLLRFAAPSAPNAPFEKLYVSAESHLHEVNRVFIYDIDTKPVNHDTVARHVFRALEGPLASCFRLYKQEYREHNRRQKRIRYLLRPSEDMSPILVERFYIPLDAPSGKQNVWGIFKPVNRNCTCPSCHKRCQGGNVSICKSAVELHRV